MLTITVSNGNWKCQACGHDLGAVQDPFTQKWTAQIPRACATPEGCSSNAVKLAEAVYASEFELPDSQ
jgi:hypothetical protein